MYGLLRECQRFEGYYLFHLQCQTAQTYTLGCVLRQLGTADEGKTNLRKVGNILRFVKT